MYLLAGVSNRMVGWSVAYTPPNPSNSSVARRLDISTSMVCRIRAGNRMGSDKFFRKMEKVYGWPYIDQVTAVSEGTYAEEFEKVINE